MTGPAATLLALAAFCAVLTVVLAGHLGCSRGPAAAWLVAGVLLAAEVLVVALVQGRQLLPAPLYLRWGVSDWRVHVGEAALGLVVLVAVWWRRPPRPSD